MYRFYVSSFNFICRLPHIAIDLGDHLFSCVMFALRVRAGWGESEVCEVGLSLAYGTSFIEPPPEKVLWVAMYNEWKLSELYLNKVNGITVQIRGRYLLSRVNLP